MKSSRNEIPHFNFELEKVLEYCSKLKNTNASIEYLQKILRLKKTNKTIIDHSLDNPNYDFVVEIKAEVKRLKRTDGKKEIGKDIIIKAGKNFSKNTDDLIWWKSSSTSLLYLFELLYESRLIDDRQYENKRSAMIEEHFKNEWGNNYQNEILNKTFSRMKSDGLLKKPKKEDAEKIENVIIEIRNLLKKMI